MLMTGGLGPEGPRSFLKSSPSHENVLSGSESEYKKAPSV